MRIGLHALLQLGEIRARLQLGDHAVEDGAFERLGHAIAIAPDLRLVGTGVVKNTYHFEWCSVQDQGVAQLAIADAVHQLTADDDFIGTGHKVAARLDAQIGLHDGKGAWLHTADGHIGLAPIQLEASNGQIHLRRHQRLPILRALDVRQRLHEDLRPFQREDAIAFVRRTLAQEHAHIVTTVLFKQRREALLQGQHAGEHSNRGADTQHRQQRGGAANQQATKVVGQRYESHQPVLRSAAMTDMLRARSAGPMPARNPMPTTTRAAVSSVPCVTS